MARRRAILMMLAVLVLAASATLRFTALDWLLPSLIEPDAHIVIQVRIMEAGAGATDHAWWDWGAYPHLVARLTQLLTAREDTPPPAGDADATLQTHLARAAWPILRVRLVVALLSLLAVPATWLLARRFVSTGWSLFAAALVGTNLLALHFGAQAKAHGAALGFDALAVVACMRLRRRGDASSYVLAGLAVAAAIACLQSGFATLLPLLVAHFGAVRGQRPARHALLAVPLACVLLALVAFYPFAFQDGTWLRLDGDAFKFGKHELTAVQFNGGGFLHLGHTLWAWDPALCVGSVLALPILWFTRRVERRSDWSPGEIAVVLAFALPYALLIGLNELSFERFLLPLVPFLAVLVAAGLARATEMSPSAAWRRVAIGCAVVLLAVSTQVAARLVMARAVPSTIDEAAVWVQDHVQPGRQAVVLAHSLDLPLFRSPANLAQDAQAGSHPFGWFKYQRTALTGVRPEPVFDLRWMQLPYVPAAQWARSIDPGTWPASLDADFAIVGIHERESPTPGTVVNALLQKSCERLARLSPDGDPEAYDIGIYYMDGSTVTPMAWRILFARCLGPVIEIYRLPRAADGEPPR